MLRADRSGTLTEKLFCTVLAASFFWPPMHVNAKQWEAYEQLALIATIASASRTDAFTPPLLLRDCHLVTLSRIFFIAASAVEEFFSDFTPPPPRSSWKCCLREDFDIRIQSILYGLCLQLTNQIGTFRPDRTAVFSQVKDRGPSARRTIIEDVLFWFLVPAVFWICKVHYRPYSNVSIANVN